MKTRYGLLPLVLVIAMHVAIRGESPPPSPQQTADDPTQSRALDSAERNASFWMDQKLRISKELLTGLALADFDMVGKNAEILSGLNRVEAFVRHEPEGYRDELRQFNMVTKALVRAAEEENLEAATLAFNRLTISCMSCHRQLREAE